MKDCGDNTSGLLLAILANHCN